MNESRMQDSGCKANYIEEFRNWGIEELKN
jgi:hypothetical protein